jgi:hypothetical protein
MEMTKLLRRTDGRIADAIELSVDIASLLTTRGALAHRGSVHWSEIMSTDRPRSRAWVDQRPVSPRGDADRPSRKLANASRVLWAERPFPVRGGLCVALTLRGNELFVGFRATQAPERLAWLPAATLLSDADAASWAKTRFNASPPSLERGPR